MQLAPCIFLSRPRKGMETDIETLRRLFAQALIDKAAAEARAVAAEAAAEAAKEAKEAAAAAKEAAEARVAAAEAAVEEGHKEKYFAALRGASASASENSPVSADTARRGAPEPVEVPLNVFFQDWPEVCAADVEASWQRCREVLCSRKPCGLPSQDALKDLPERAFVHDVMFPLLDEMTCSTDLRLWREGHLADSIPLAEAIPDMLWTHARDMSASSLGALLCGDIKRWGQSQLKSVCTVLCCVLLSY
jgi:hypothetical protein